MINPHIKPPPYDQMTNDEFDERMAFEKWANDQKYNTKNSVSLYEAMDIFEEEIYDICLDHLGDPMESKDHFNSLLNKLKAKKLSGDSDLDVEKARQRNILEVTRSFSDEPQKVTFNRNFPCVLHNEKTGSMKIYKNNSYYCFGCNKGGDVIDLVMRKTGKEFVDTVKFLM